MSVAFTILTTVDKAHKKAWGRGAYRLCEVFDDVLDDVLPPWMIWCFCISFRKDQNIRWGGFKCARVVAPWTHFAPSRQTTQGVVVYRFAPTGVINTKIWSRPHPSTQNAYFWPRGPLESIRKIQEARKRWVTPGTGNRQKNMKNGENCKLGCLWMGCELFLSRCIW